MPIFQIDNNSIQPIEAATFSGLGLLETQDLQSLLKSRIDVISPDTLVVAEEFSEWEDSNRSIDLLGIDKAANVVVIELKRTRDGDHMELQAIRYAAMIAALTFEKAVAIYSDYLRKNGIDGDSRDRLLKFLDWPEPDEDRFGQEVRIVLASGGFSRELTTSVLWLNEFDLDIRCVRMQPYDNNGQILLDVQTIIPMPETEDYQVRIQEKRRQERASRYSERDWTKFDIEIAGNRHTALSKRWMMFHLVSGVIESGITPQQIVEVVGKQLFEEFDGELDAEQVQEEIMKSDTGGRVAKVNRYFCKRDGELFHSANKTYALSNQWWSPRAENTANSLAKAFPDLKIGFRPTGS